MICMIRCMLGFVMGDKHDRCMVRDDWCHVMCLDEC